jgi:hypothetical protein
VRYPSTSGRVSGCVQGADTILVAGTNPIHNKKAKKATKELDEDDLAHKAKLQAGQLQPPSYLLTRTSHHTSTYGSRIHGQQENELTIYRQEGSR